jgi:hypothetical protein
LEDLLLRAQLPLRWSFRMACHAPGSGWPEHSGLGEGETGQEAGLAAAVLVQVVRDGARSQKNAGVSID